MSASELPNDAPRARKSFIPLECNPELMTKLVHELGLSPNLGFVDVYSISDPDLLAFVPRPALALLLVFPVSLTYENHRREEDKDRQEYDEHGEGEDPIWFKQTIRNACGLIGVLHAAANGAARDMIQLGTPLSRLLSEVVPLSTLPRAKYLEESNDLEVAHKSVASKGDSTVPDAEDVVELHYVCFIKSVKDNHLYELDGRRKGPLDRGYIGESADVLSEEATEVIQGFMDREKESGRLEFSLIALAPNLD